MGKDSGLAGSEFPLPSALSTLQSELSETRRRLAEADQALNERRAGEVNTANSAAITPDIGARRRTPAAALHETERDYRALFEQSPLGMARLSTVTSRFVQVNGAFCDLVGYSVDEVVKLTPGDLTFADDREADAVLVGNLLRGETDSYDAQKRYVHKDGRLIWVRVRATLLRDAQGNPNETFAIVEDISDRKLAVENLRASELRARLATQAAGIGIWEWNVRTGLIRWDLEMFRLYGMAPTPDLVVHYRDWSRALAPEDLAEQECILQETVSRCGESRREFRLYRRDDGECRQIEAVEIARPDAQGRTEWITGTNLDVTERKQAEAALHASEEFARTVLEASPDCLKVIGADGRLEYVNQNGACLLELDDRSDVVGQPWESLWPDSARTTIGKSIEAAKAGQLVKFTAEGPAAKGTPKHWDVSVVAVPSQVGEPVRLLATSRDVTEKIGSEIALRKSEARFRAAVEAVDGIVWTNNAIGEMTGEQPGWSALTGQTLAEYQGFGWSQAVHPDDAQPTIEAWNAAVAAKGLFEFEHRVRRQDGEWRHFSIRAVPIFDRESRITEWVGVHTDISAQKVAEAQLDFLMRELAHRSKNQLAVVQAIAGLTARNAHSLDEFSKDFAERIHGLAVSTDILLAQRWDGAPLVDLVSRQLQPFGTDNGRLICEGPDIFLTPDAAQSIGLALHELATNCVKHGAWSLPTGVVRFSWTLDREGAQPPQLRVNWIEHGGPPVSPPTRKGFGHIVIERMTAQQLDGAVELTFAPQGLSWTLVVSATHFVEGSGGGKVSNSAG